jgi:hypothetical protein
VLSIELLTTFLLFAVGDGNRYGVGLLLENFWEDARAQGIALPCEKPVSASAVCQARQRLPDNLFRVLLAELVTQVREVAGAPRWRGRRLLAVDGALINVRRSDSLRDAYGFAKNTYNPQVRYSVMLDVFTRMPVDFAIGGRMQVGEREQLHAMLPSARPGDVLILDRGYPSFDVIQACLDARLDFLMRCPTSQTFKFFDEFRDSGATEATISVDLRQGGDADVPKANLRLIRCDGAEGPVFYITSLTSAEADLNEIMEIYHLRWQVEEYFKLATSEFVGQKQLRSMTPFGVRQELGALTLHLAMSRVLASEAQADAKVTPNKRVSQKAAVSALQRKMVAVLLADDVERIRARILDAIGRILRTLEPLRPPRVFPRVSKRPRRKWGPRGKTRA